MSHLVSSQLSEGRSNLWLQRLTRLLCSSRSRTGFPGQFDQRSGAVTGQPVVPQQPPAGGSQPARPGRRHVRARRHRPGKRLNPTACGTGTCEVFEPVSHCSVGTQSDPQ